MKNLKLFITSAFAVCALSLVNPVKADPILDAGWAGDTITASATDSIDSPYVYALSGAAIFSITDAFIVGDTYKVYDFGSLILTTAVGSGAAFSPSDAIADAAWASGLYSIGSVLLGAGAHSITVQGDGKGGLPAGLYARLDTARGVPDNAASIGLLGLGLMAIVAARRRLS